MSFFSSNWIAAIEAVSVFSLILLYIWSWRFTHPLAWLPILLLILASHLFRRETPSRLGFNRRNWKPLLRALTPALLLIAFAIVALSAAFGDIRSVTPRSGLGSLAVYCIWGTFQQYLLNGYFVNRFAQLSPSKAPLLAAIFFSGAHMPNWFLMIVTLAGGFACAKLYLKFRNLYFLGLAHGCVGFLLYLCVPDSISHHFYVGPRWFS